MLNASQHEAVHAEAPLVVVAPPGSGKTQCIIRRVQHLLAQGQRAEEILCLTFTNKAAGEMRERLARVVEPHVAKTLQLTTFHSFCLRLCREQGWIDRRASIWGDAETRKAVEAILKARTARDDPSPEAEPQQAELRAQVTQAVALLGTRSASDFSHGSDERHIFESYARAKTASGAIDFDDMQSVVMANVRARTPDANPLRRYSSLIVDEWQDTSHLQLQLISLFPTRAVAVVGDPHQSIYGFRGAAWSNWERFCAIYSPRIVALSTNYRSTAIISDLCQRLIALNDPVKLGVAMPQVATVQPQTDAVTVVRCGDSEREAEWVAMRVSALRAQGVALSQVAILYRSNSRQRTSSVLERHLIRAGVPYDIVAGQALFKHKTIAHVLALLRLLVNPRDEMAFSACVHHPQPLDKSFDGEWKLYRGPLSSTAALARLAASGVGSELTAHRARLFALAKLLRTWSAMLPSTDVSLSDFIERHLVPDAGVARDEGRFEQLHRCMGETRSGTLEDQMIAFLELAALSSASDRREGDKLDACVLSTIHQAKGLEWTAVFVVNLLDSVLPSKQSQSRGEDGTDGVQEERRLFYVAMSRAKRHLFLTHPAPGPDGRRSRFLDEVSEVAIPKLPSRAPSALGFSSARVIAASANRRNDHLVFVDYKCDDENGAEPAEPAASAEAAPKRARVDAFALLMQHK